MIPFDLILESKKVLLRPIEENDYNAFLQLAKQDEEMWQYFSLNLADEVQLKRWMDMAFSDKKAGTRRPFTIIEKETGLIAGSSSMGNISYYDLRLEIGWSWLGKNFRSTGINKHAKFLMMRYAFDKLNFERVEFKTDVLNARARQGLKNVGGIEEGILRSHTKMWNNRRRTSIYYSVLKDEWPLLIQTIFKGME
ncbi:MAG: GNAT family N-acetyltransferase [Chitinophagaceae bacterium]